MCCLLFRALGAEGRFMSCDACEAAQHDPNCGRYNDRCRGCYVRTIASGPKHVRERLYEIERALGGPEALLKLKGEVKVEYERIKALKEKQ
jgi:hypothetical protein